MSIASTVANCLEQFKYFREQMWVPKEKTEESREESGIWWFHESFQNDGIFYATLIKFSLLDFVICTEKTRCGAVEISHGLDKNVVRIR